MDFNKDPKDLVVMEVYLDQADTNQDTKMIIMMQLTTIILAKHNTTKTAYKTTLQSMDQRLF